MVELMSKIISSRPGGTSGRGGSNWTKTKFCSIKGGQARGGAVILTKWRPLSLLPASRARWQVCARAKRWRAPSAHNYTECWWRNLGRNGCKVNFSDAVHICRQFFLGDVPPPILEAMLMRYISPIRPGRKDTRKLTQKSSASFTYRVA